MHLVVVRYFYKKKTKNNIFSILLGITMYVLLKLPGIV
jgi:hypothetical protein